MRVHTAVVLTAAVAVAWLSPGVGAQPKPDFSGRWQIDLGKSKGGTGLASKDLVIVITQDATTLKIEQPGMPTILYRLDGTPVKNPRPGRGGEATYTSAWDGDRLVTTVTGGQPNQKETRYMERGEMVDESTLHSAIGPTFARKLYWKKIGS
jgi:hypothetical protein